MPAGSLVTVPVPDLTTVSVYLGSAVKVAATLWAALMVTVQIPVPVQAPLQPANLEPAAGVGVNVTLVPPA